MEYRNINELIPWEKNKEARQITDVNWEKLKADIKKRGVKDSFKIGQDNTVYDGNNRLRAVNYWIDQGVTNADNGKDLLQIPVEIYETPTEASKWELALTGNEQFASWNKEGLNNYLPEFENELELSLFNIEFDDPESIDEQLVSEETEYKNKEIDKEKIAKDLNIKCPKCGFEFKGKEGIETFDNEPS